MDKKGLTVLLAVLMILAIASLFVILYVPAATGKIIAGIFLAVTIGILILVNRKK